MTKPIVPESIQNEIVSALAPMKRRRFLTMAVHGLLVAGAGSLVSACTESPVGDMDAGKALSSSQMAFFQRLAQILLPTDGTEMAPLESVPVLRNLDEMFNGMSAQIRSDLGKAIDLFEYGGLVMGWNFSRFTRMSEQDAVLYIDSWQAGHPVLLGIATVLKKLVYAAYWRDARTWGALQFAGPVSETWGLPSLGEAPLPLLQKV